jgi:hypothetical protein
MAFVTGHLTGNKEGWSKRVDLCLIRKSAIKRRPEDFAFANVFRFMELLLIVAKQLASVLVVSLERLLHQTNFKKCSW